MKSQIQTDHGGDNSLGTDIHGSNHIRGQSRAVSRGMRMCMQQLLEARLRSAHVAGTMETMVRVQRIWITGSSVFR